MKRCIIFFLITFLLNGCMTDNRDYCPDDGDARLILYLTYKDDLGFNVFDDRIDIIDILIYNEDLTFNQRLLETKNNLNRDRSVSVKIAPGTYHVLCWANNYSSRESIEDLDLSTRLGQSYIYQSNTDSGDPLHYAPDTRNFNYEPEDDQYTPYKVVVKEVGVTEHTVPFVSAHRTVNMFLKNFPEPGNPALDNPDITISELPYTYDFLLSRGDTQTSFEQTATDAIVEQELMGYATFYIPNFAKQNTVKLTVEGNANYNYSFPFTMDEILEELKLVPEEGDHMIINLVVEWGDGTFVRIYLAPWTSVNVKPGT